MVGFRPIEVSLLESGSAEFGASAWGSPLGPHGAVEGVDELDGTRNRTMHVPIPLKRAVAAVICQPPIGRVIARLTSDRIPIDGLRISTRSPSVPPGAKARIFWGIYEGAERRYVRRYLNPTLDVVELGASLGVVTCEILRKVDPEVRVVAVEANAELREDWQRTLSENHPGHAVALVTAAIEYDHAGSSEVEFEVAPNPAGSHLGTHRSIHSHAVRRTTLSELIRDFDIGKFALVCDIEGAEAGILLSDVSALQSCEQLIIELHETTTAGEHLTIAGLERLVRDLGFRTLERHGGVVVASR